MRNSRYISVLLGGILAVVVCAAPALATGLQDEARATEMPAEPPTPSVQDVYVVMRDMGLAYENVQIRTIVPNEKGVSALIGLSTGTLVDVEMTQVANGWTMRDIYYIAGSANDYRTWSEPWRERVAEAARFLAAAAGDGSQPRRRAEELAPLVWFEDTDDTNRLWGLNPTTYRLMQTLKMMPDLAGPLGNSGRR